MKEINAKFRSYCATCLFTIFKNEVIAFDGKPHHLNCLTALKDEFPRIMSPTNQKLYGKVNRVKWAQTLKENGYKSKGKTNSSNYKHRANRGVRLTAGR